MKQIDPDDTVNDQHIIILTHTTWSAKLIYHKIGTDEFKVLKSIESNRAKPARLIKYWLLTDEEVERMVLPRII